MIVDTSAIIAILRDEPEALPFAAAIGESRICRVSAVNFVEASIVFDVSRDPILSRKFDDFFLIGSVAVEPVTIEQARVAREAYRDFGKGGGHPAKLNFGDCFAYALAKVKSEPILFKGEDFRKTDLTPALD
jgi:ribonuclease VapC